MTNSNGLHKRTFSPQSTACSRSANRENLLDAAVADAKANNLDRLNPVSAFFANARLDALSGIADGLQLERTFPQLENSPLRILGPSGPWARTNRRSARTSIKRSPPAAN